MSESASIIGVIQARMASTRLPGKSLAPIAGVPLLQVIIERVRSAAVGEWWIATTDTSSDDVTEAWGDAMGLRVLRGDADDVLSRFARIASERRPEWIVRLTGDNPYVDASIVDLLLAALPTVSPSTDCVVEAEPRRLPLGYVPEVARASALVELAGRDLYAHHRAHVTSALREAGRTAFIEVPAAWPSRPSWRWTVDTRLDLSTADATFRAIGESWRTARYPEIVATLDHYPEIATRNASVAQKEVAAG